MNIRKIGIGFRGRENLLRLAREHGMWVSADKPWRIAAKHGFVVIDELGAITAAPTHDGSIVNKPGYGRLTPSMAWSLLLQWEG